MLRRNAKEPKEQKNQKEIDEVLERPSNDCTTGPEQAEPSNDGTTAQSHVTLVAGLEQAEEQS